MIHRISVTNFQSIRHRVELDFRIAGTSPKKSCFRESPSRPDVRLPSVVVLVGANGAGKTTLLRALVATIRFASLSYGEHGAGHIPLFTPFLALEAEAPATRIEVEFDSFWPVAESAQDATMLRYTLVLGRADEGKILPTHVEYEALHDFPKSRPRRIFERRRDKRVYVSRDLGIRSRDDRLSAIPKNASVISTLAGMDLKPFPEIVNDLNGVQTNIAGSEPWRIEPDALPDIYGSDRELTGDISKKLSRFDLGIRQMKLYSANNRTSQLAFEHEGLDIPVLFGNESAGTRHLVRVYPQLDYAIRNGHLAIMDDLNTHLHPELSSEILRWFRQRDTNPNSAQLICSMHDLSVLDDLEKEELFIVEKDDAGATHVHGARDVIGLRRDVNLAKQYRGGLIGGLPVLG